MSYSNKIEKEKKQLAKEAGMVRTEVTGAEVSILIQNIIYLFIFYYGSRCLRKPEKSVKVRDHKQSATLATSPKTESSRNYVGLVKAHASLARQSDLVYGLLGFNASATARVISRR